jgi:cytochrome P450
MYAGEACGHAEVVVSTGFSSAEGVNLDDTLSLTGAGNFIAADPPDHDRLRKVVRGRFTPAAVAALEGAVRDDVRATLATAVREGGFDAADALAWAIPVRTVSRLLGLPVQHEPALRGWLRAVIHREAESDVLPDSARAAGRELRAYLADQIADRRRVPGDDLISDIVAGKARGELDEAEIPGLCILLYVAGTETVADFIGNALVALAEHPHQRALLAARPELGGAAVDELLRYESPVPRLQGRIVLEEVLKAMPEYRLDGPVERIATHNTRGVARLPIAAFLTGAVPAASLNGPQARADGPFASPLGELPASVRWQPAR